MCNSWKSCRDEGGIIIILLRVIRKYWIMSNVKFPEKNFNRVLMSIHILPAHLSNHFKLFKKWNKKAVRYLFYNRHHCNDMAIIILTSHDDFIRFLIYSNLKKSYIYFISISTSSTHVSIYYVPRAVNCKSIARRERTKKSI